MQGAFFCWFRPGMSRDQKKKLYAGKKKTGRFSVAVLSRLSLGRVPVCPWDDCPSRVVRKMFMCFVFIVFFAPNVR